MTRISLPMLLAVCVLAAACATGTTGDQPEAPTAEAPTTLLPAPAGTESPPVTTDAPPATGSAPAATAPPAAGGFDGPPAPDFALALENRDGTFSLSASPNPVYLVFWAEW